ncbi:peptidase [Anaerobacillus isosaccharinicus]|uniref:Acetylornithine deacetylase n=1 Tax=Anaerobacillus isosaccharinicus TaxID=1532552 RepID=A0A1S2KX72_9BACI|nr:peptidase [Anaerobacillus isosaccharinicus]MBA5586841.1 peptidase [Anaerobacillus isosaccharinicus]QOY34946.1 peptidase [Anaerobacillus isosaccharinicus]
MSNLQEKISQWLQIHRQEAVHFLQQLVQFPSTQGNEASVQELIASKLQKMGLEVDQWELDGIALKKHPYFFSNRETFLGSPNVVGVLKGTGGGNSIVLNGHVDVVPAGDLRQWENPPYDGLINDGKMYGRGTTDMKGGNLALYLAVETIKQLNIQLKGDVILHSVVEEESGGAGTLAAIMKGYHADAAIIPEPTDMRIFPKQQGSKWFRVHVKGRSAHGGTRYQGVSAIEKSSIVVKHIEKLETLRNKRINEPLYKNIPIPVPINIGRIEGGDWPSSVADLVKLEGRIGIAPNEKIEDVQQELDSWLKELAKVDTWFDDHPVELEWYGAQWLPGAIDEKHPLMVILQANYEKVTGKAPVIEASPWGTDGGLLTQVGKTPSIVFGPGTSSMAHFPNEYIEIEQIFKAAEIIALTVIDWCGTENGGVNK